MNDLGIFAWFGFPAPLAERIRQIADAGFVATCLWLGPGEELVDSGRADTMPDMVRNAGLALDNVHAAYEDCNLLWSDSEDERDRIRRAYLEGLAYCQRHGIPNLVAHVSSGKTPPPCSESGLRLLSDLCKSAEDLGVTLALENTGRPDYLERIFQRLTSPRLRFCYDSSHDFINGAPPGRVLEAWGHLLATTHLSDNNGETDDHYLPGEGTGDWGLVTRALASNPYRGVLMLEVVPAPSEQGSAQGFLTRAFDSATKLRGRLPE